MKKIIISLFCLLLLVGCSHKTVKDAGCESDCGIPNTVSHNAQNFKEHYESLNNDLRKVEIAEDNNFVPISIKELNEKLVNNEDMILYISSNQCPYCRSVIETADQVSRELGVYDIFVIEAWDNDRNEIFRDEYINGEVVENNDVYSKLLELDSNNILQDWVKDGKDLGRKRIYLPTFLYIENNEILFMETGISDLQKEPNQELTDEIKEDMYNKLYNFFEKCPRG